MVSSSSWVGNLSSSSPESPGPLRQGGGDFSGIIIEKNISANKVIDFACYDKFIKYYLHKSPFNSDERDLADLDLEKLRSLQVEE